ncbi:hypothetical protein GO986_20670 [Deinococcus sp. HMF7620]|uniref:Uncharacterized protein n=1 Tax=Deinococcus arboris TaxID=2682977 RepID=A0A7C9HU74_9DEIO|nr:hypothetical protein [Deinococcus arboris]MVN89153.1 hypothetical protein [Deinococcus arboris]
MSTPHPDTPAPAPLQALSARWRAEADDEPEGRPSWSVLHYCADELDLLVGAGPEQPDPPDPSTWAEALTLLRDAETTLIQYGGQGGYTLSRLQVFLRARAD